MMEREEKVSIAKRFKFTSSPIKIFAAILVFALLAGLGTGYILASTSTGKKIGSQISLNENPKTAQQDAKTFKDFAEGKITKKPEPKKAGEYTEGTHLLMRENAVPVALTSSVVDLSEYENKSVKVYGETQKALKEGWLMDVGRVEER